MIQPTKKQSKTQVEEDPFEVKIYFNPDQYTISAKDKNIISKKSCYAKPQNIQTAHKLILQHKLIIQSDLAKIVFGKCAIICEGVLIKPPYKRHNMQIKYLPIQIGAYVFINKNTIVQAMKIGNHVKIGKECIINARTTIGENVILLDQSIVPSDSILAPNSVYGGKPATYLGQLPQSFSIVQRQMCVDYYNNFIPKEGNTDRKRFQRTKKQDK